jgi:hypothetical protein
MLRVSERHQSTDRKHINEMGRHRQDVGYLLGYLGRGIAGCGHRAQMGRAAVDPAVNSATGRIRELETDLLTGSSSTDRRSASPTQLRIGN